MNKQDSIDKLFDNLQGQFDLEHPQPGHEERFLKRLQQHQPVEKAAPKRSIWPVLAIAASFALVISVGISVFNAGNPANQIDPEFKKTEFYFASVLQTEMEKLEAEDSPVTKKLVEDTMIQMNKLEADYLALEKKLQQPGDQKLILHAMITNFQTRINLLQDVLQQIENIKQLKNNSDENTII